MTPLVAVDLPPYPDRGCWGLTGGCCCQVDCPRHGACPHLADCAAALWAQRRADIDSGLIPDPHLPIKKETR